MTKHEKILIVDDEDGYRILINRILNAHGYQCLEAADTAAALKVLKAESIDLCLLDINMPGKPGDEFLKELKNSYPEVAVIMSSGISNLDIASKCREYGADDYLVKSFEPERLVISLQNVLDRRRLQQENLFYRTQLEKKLAEQAEKLRASQSMLIQQEKLAAIGQLAAGVAHEINNPLGFINSNLNALNKYIARIAEYKELVEDLCKSVPAEVLEGFKSRQRKLKIDVLLEDMPELIAESLEGADRIMAIIRSLKSFSRTDQAEAVNFSVNECIENAITVVWNEIKYNSKLERDFADLPMIQCFPQQLAQVFMNLLVNASHAISSDGLIKIATVAAEKSIIVTISDNGCGIAPENLNKIFDPFFTTKPTGKGTGLGMSIASDIILKHKGAIDVVSTPGQGTTFTVTLPVTSTSSQGLH